MAVQVREIQHTVNFDIEFLRALAIALTLVQHVEFVPGLSHLVTFLPQGISLWFGVDVFFCVSGYVIARSLQTEWHQQGKNVQAAIRWIVIRRFWTRRIWRLWPSAWVWAWVPVGLAFGFNQSGVFGSASMMMGDAWAAVLQLANLHWMQCFANGEAACNLKGWVLINHWSLSLEEQFYVIFPLVFLWLRRRWFVALCLVAVFVQFAQHRLPLSGLWFFRTDALILGVLIALLASHLRMSAAWLQRMRAIALAGVLVISLAQWGLAANAHTLPWAVGGIAVLSAALVWLASQDQHLLGCGDRIDGFVRWLGMRSYTLYLVHLPVYGVVWECWQRWGKTPDGALDTLALTAVVVLCLWLVTELNYRLLEQPLRAYGRRRAATIG